MKRKYHMILQSPMGPREGTLTLKEDGGAVAGTLDILAHQLPVSGRRTPDGCLQLTHQMITAVSAYPCQTALWDSGTALLGELQMDQSGALWGCSRYQSKTTMPWHGELLE